MHDLGGKEGAEFMRAHNRQRSGKGLFLVCIRSMSSKLDSLLLKSEALSIGAILGLLEIFKEMISSLIGS